MHVLLILKILFSFEISLTKVRHLPSIIWEFTASEATFPSKVITAKVTYDKRFAHAFNMETLWKETLVQRLDIKKEVLYPLSRPFHSSSWNVFCHAYPFKIKAPWVSFLESKIYFWLPFNRRGHRSKGKQPGGSEGNSSISWPPLLVYTRTRDSWKSDNAMCLQEWEGKRIEWI